MMIKLGMACTTSPRMRCVTIAPIMMMVSPAAASGVNLGWMRSAQGRIKPMPPRTSRIPIVTMNPLENGKASKTTFIGSGGKIRATP